MPRQLYTLPIPTDAKLQSRAEIQRQVSGQGVLQSDVPSVQSISLDPGQRLLRGQLRGRFSKAIAAGFEELFEGSAIEAVPYFDRDEATTVDGYYTLTNETVEQPEARSPLAHQYDGVLTKVGTRRSHWRAVTTNATTETNPFGSATTEYVGVSTRADRVRWYNSETKATENATVQATREGEHDAITVYDAAQSSYNDPVLIYTIPYEEEWPTDVRVWDDYGRDKVYREDFSGETVGSTTVGSTTVDGERTVPSTWQRVYRTTHDYVGQALLENDLLRLEPVEGDQLYAYQWTDADEVYKIVQLGASAWRLVEFDITEIGLEHVTAQAEWSDGTSSYRLNLALRRGRDTVQFWEPANAGGSTPAGLVTRLDPIAGDSDRVTGASQTLVKRSEVNE